MKAFLAGLLAIGALVLGTASATAGAAQEAPHRLLGLVPHAAHANRVAPVRLASKASGFNCVSSCTSYAATINQYFTDVAADNGLTTNVYSVATQYSGIESNETFGGSYVDGRPFPTGPAYVSCQDYVDKFCVTDSQLQEEIANVIAKNHWPTESPTALYVIFTPANVGVCQYSGDPNVQSNPCTTNVFCAYHSQSPHFIYAVVPDAAAVSGGACDAGEAAAGNDADATISMVSHEQIEAITNPDGGGWYSSDGAEIADLCAWDFGTPLGSPGAQYNQVINGHNYLLQLEYSNQDGGCVPYLGGPVTAPDPRNGAGPLVNHADAVMTTNTVYAIYWVPVRPASKKPPAISGAPKVGKKLRALRGTWSGSQKFSYRWLRCSSKGTSCKGISRATTSSYTVVRADVHRRLTVRVTATNVAGQTKAFSAPTATVKR